jgi:hypothetical protein
MNQMETVKKNMKYYEFAKVELLLEILKIQERYQLSNEEVVAVIGNTLLSIGDNEKRMRAPK